jgi:hypothetical protein
VVSRPSNAKILFSRDGGNFTSIAEMPYEAAGAILISLYVFVCIAAVNTVFITVSLFFRSLRPLPRHCGQQHSSPRRREPLDPERWPPQQGSLDLRQQHRQVDEDKQHAHVRGLAICLVRTETSSSS